MRLRFQVFIFQKIKYHDHDIVRYRRVHRTMAGIYTSDITGLEIQGFSWIGADLAEQVSEQTRDNQDKRNRKDGTTDRRTGKNPADGTCIREKK